MKSYAVTCILQNTICLFKIMFRKVFNDLGKSSQPKLNGKEYRNKHPVLSQVFVYVHVGKRRLKENK